MGSVTGEFVGYRDGVGFGIAESYGKPGVFRDEFGTFVWQPHPNGEFDILRVTVCEGAVPERVDETIRHPTMMGTVRRDGRPTTSIGRSHETIRQMRAARDNPKRITTDQLVPPDVRKFYDVFWQGEQRALEQHEQNRLDQEQRRRRMWWWQRVREALWVR